METVFVGQLFWIHGNFTVPYKICHIYSTGVYVDIKAKSNMSFLVSINNLLANYIGFGDPVYE